MAASAAAVAWLAAANVDEAQLREAIRKLIPEEDLGTTTIGALRGKLEGALELSQGALDGCKAEVNRILQDELMSHIQANGGNDEGDDEYEAYKIHKRDRKNRKRAKMEYPEIDLDISLAKLPSLGLPLDSSSEETDSEERHAKKRERKEAKAKKNKGSALGRALSNRPTPMSKKKHWKPPTPEEISSRDMVANVRAQKQSAVLEAVERYVSENPNWSASAMKEDITEQNAWENNTEFANMFKICLANLDLGNGGNIAKGDHH